MKNISIKGLLYFVLGLMVVAGLVIIGIIQIYLKHFTDKDKKASLANMVVKESLLIRLDEKRYMLTRDDKYIQQINKKVDDLVNLAVNLKESFDDEENQKTAQEVVDVVKRYKNLINEYHLLDKKLEKYDTVSNEKIKKMASLIKKITKTKEKLVIKNLSNSETKRGLKFFGMLNDANEALERILILKDIKDLLMNIIY